MKKLIVLLAAFAILSTGAGAVYDPQVAEEEAAMDAASIETSVFSGEAAEADLIDVAAPAAILIEKTTGTVLYEKNADERMLPASVTKVMSILLIAEAVESGVISLDDAVSVSAYAAGMGGSQVYLEAGEQMTVRELLKCIVVVSANDATVAMAEACICAETITIGRCYT